VETNFDSFVFQGCKETVDAVCASVGRLGVAEPGVDEALGDTLSFREGFLALKSSNSGKSRLEGLRDSPVCTNVRLGNVQGVRYFRCGIDCRTNRGHGCFKRHVRTCRIKPISHSKLGVDTRDEKKIVFLC
jgi:hypothetical protein